MKGDVWVLSVCVDKELYCCCDNNKQPHYVITSECRVLRTSRWSFTRSLLLSSPHASVSILFRELRGRGGRLGWLLFSFLTCFSMLRKSSILSMQTQFKFWCKNSARNQEDNKSNTHIDILYMIRYCQIQIEQSLRVSRVFVW